MHPWRVCVRLWALALALASAAVAQSGLVVSPSELSLAVPFRSTAPATGSFSLTGGQPGAPYVATVRHLGPVGGWLAITPATGVAPATISVSADATSLAPGIYNAQITVQAGGIARVVTVVLAVGENPAVSGFILNPTAMTFLGTSGAQVLTPQTLSIGVAGGASVPFRLIASSSGWLSVPPVVMTAPTAIAVEVFQYGLRPGRHDGAIAVVPISGGPPTVIPVTLIAGATTSTTPALVLSQPAITVTYQTGTFTPQGQSVSVLNTTGVFEFTATTTAPWLRMTTTFTTAPSQTVTGFTQFNTLIEPAGLTPGVYTTVVTISSTGVPTVELPVTLRVTTEAGLNAYPSSISLDDVSALLGSTAVVGTGNASLSFTITPASTGNWLRATPASGSTSTGVQSITVEAVTTGLAIGQYSGAVTLQPTTGPALVIPVRLTVTTAPVTSTLVVYSSAVTLSAVTGQADPTAIIQLGADSSNHPYTANASSTTGWLQVDPVSGIAPGRLTVRANLANVPSPGTYTGIVQVTSLLNSTQTNVPVTLTVVAEALTVQPDSLTFTQTRRGDPPAEQTLRIESNVPASFRITDRPEWLRLSDGFGRTPMTITLWPTISVLPPGTNVSVVRVVGPRNTVEVPVRFVPLPPPQLTTNPSEVSLRYAFGDPTAPSQTITVATEDVPMEYKVQVTTENGARWLTATPGGMTPGGVVLTVDPTLLVPGRFSANVIISLADNSQTKTVPVMITVGAPVASILSVLHGATMGPGPVAPGQILTVTGSQLGPLTGISARPNAAGAYETRIGDTRVLFDGIPAPLMFLRNDQINLIAPYSLQGRVSTRLQVEQGTNWSHPVELRVVDSLPGLFTVGGSGRGQVMAVNADLTMNSGANPAPRGSVVSIFGTGEGQTEPGGQDGRVILTDLRKPLLPVTATVGGRPAEVLYAGSAPNTVSGTLQVNIRIPDNVEPGVLPVQIMIGTATSQPGVTLVVR